MFMDTPVRVDVTSFVLVRNGVIILLVDGVNVCCVGLITLCSWYFFLIKGDCTV
jgi:hypothetical protein